MQLARSGRFVFVAQWVAALLLPVFFFIGRGFLGAELGWMAIIGIVYGAVVIALMFVPPILTLFDREGRRRGRTRSAYDIATFVLWAAFVVAAISVPDSSDSGHLDSALTVWTGGAVDYEASTDVFTGAAIVAGLAYLAVLALAIAGIVRGRRAVAS
jgi:predicted RND superfamily exporter protein